VAELRAITALGALEAAVVTLGPLTITERVDVALASVAARRGQVLPAFSPALPGPARWAGGTPFSAFWVASEMWFVEAPLATHEALAGHLKAVFGSTASITEQTDAWVIFDLAGADLAALLERLCNVDFRAAPPGHATRTVIEHLGVYLVKHGTGAARLFGPRSSARSLLHALEVAARSAFCLK
jgi:sarcosine oxidase, subunit gamma